MPDRFIVLNDGQVYHLDRPDAAVIRPATVAHASAQINRYTGHCSRPYSVAEHQLLVADILERDLGVDVHGLFAGLNHDSHEIVTNDMHSPGKRVIGEPWRAFENVHARVFATAFGMHTALAMHREAIKRADLIAMATEVRDLMPHHGPAAEAEWDCLRGVEPLARVHLNDLERRTAPWTWWRDEWMRRFEALDWARAAALHREAEHV